MQAGSTKEANTGQFSITQAAIGQDDLPPGLIYPEIPISEHHNRLYQNVVIEDNPDGSWYIYKDLEEFLDEYGGGWVIAGLFGTVALLTGLGMMIDKMLP